MQFTQTSSTRPDTILGKILVGGEARVFDRVFGDASGFSVAAGDVVGLNETSGQWEPYDGGVSHKTVGVVLEAATLGAAETATLPVLQAGAVKLSALGANVPAAWKAGMVVGLLILC